MHDALPHRGQHKQSKGGRVPANTVKLRGRNLACRCALDGPCPADLLLLTNDA
ncbi:MAG: DUF4326 domain-containing protein [Burkholderiaceae bacterium]